MTAPAVAPSAGSAELATALTGAYVSTTGALRDRVSLAVSAMFGQQGWGDAGAAAYAEAMAPVADAAQQTMASLTAGYLAQQVALLGGGPSVPVFVAPASMTGGALRGVDPAALLRRPYEQVWSALAQDKPLDQAVEIGHRRAQSIAMTDLQLAKTAAARQQLAGDHRVVGYRRVLTNARACGMCVVASTVRYRKQDLMPIHPGCDCAVAPIVGAYDPGRTINSATLAPDAAPGEGGLYQHSDVLDLGDLLEATHRAIEDRFGRRATDAAAIDYRKVILVRQHGELGPVLTVADHNFTRRQVERGNLRAKPGTKGRRR